jgi:tetratricopeptide (TPR) repeat protein
MKNLIRLFCVSLLAVSLGPAHGVSGSGAFLNRIEGTVYDPGRLPIENVNIELLNDVDSMVGRARTTATGRFSFTGVQPGRYTVKALPLGTNLMEQSQEVNIQNVNRGGDTAYVDIFLRYDKRREAENAASHEVVFAQEVPAAAKTLFQEGVTDLGKAPDKAIAKLEKALQIFPEYFDALNWMGKVYISQKEFEKAVPPLTKATEVNPRSYSASYGLGFALYQLKRYPAALDAVKISVGLYADSIDAQLLYGSILRIGGRFPDAEKALLKANTLAKSTNGDVHWQLALLYNRLGRNQEAVTELETYLKLVPDTPDKAKIQDLIAKLKASANKKS